MTDFWLIQRLSPREYVTGRETGFDKLFALEYMGSAEFEFGEVQNSIKRIQMKKVVVETEWISVGDKVVEVFFVGHKGVHKVARDFQIWADGQAVTSTFKRRPYESKEHPFFEEIVDGENNWRGTCAWWSLRGDFAWAIDKEVADKLAEGFNDEEGIR